MSEEIKVGQRMRTRHRASAADGRRAASFYIMILAGAAVAVTAMGRFKETWMDVLVLVGLLVAVVAGMFIIRGRVNAPDADGDATPPDSYPPDSSHPDSSAPDAGPPGSGSPDSGSPDSGSPDSDAPHGPSARQSRSPPGAHHPSV